MKEKIKFNDLDTKLKIAIVISYTIGVLYIIAFFIGFIQSALKP